MVLRFLRKIEGQWKGSQAQTLGWICMGLLAVPSSMIHGVFLGVSVLTGKMRIVIVSILCSH